MATYALQFITAQGAVWGQKVLNKDHATREIQGWVINQTNYALVVLVVGGSMQERTRLGDLAVADVFYNRRDALRFIDALFEGVQKENE